MEHHGRCGLWAGVWPCSLVGPIEKCLLRHTVDMYNVLVYKFTQSSWMQSLPFAAGRFSTSGRDEECQIAAVKPTVQWFFLSLAVKAGFETEPLAQYCSNF